MGQYHTAPHCSALPGTQFNTAENEGATLSLINGAPSLLQHFITSAQRREKGEDKGTGRGGQRTAQPFK